MAGTAGGVIPGPSAKFTQTDGPRVDIFLVTSLIHADLVLPATPHVRAAFAFARTQGVPVEAPGTEWVVAGWGARGFYAETPQWRNLKPLTVLRATVGDAAVMRLDAVGPFDTAHPQLRRFTINESQLHALVSAIAADVAESSALPVAGFSSTDAFFPAQGRFSALRTCNVWAGEMLRAAGINAGIWTPVPWSLPSGS